MRVTFQNVTVTVDLPEGQTDARIAYAELCRALGSAEPCAMDWETDTYVVSRGRLDVSEEETTAGLFPNESSSDHQYGNHATWNGVCLDCGIAVPQPPAETGE